MVIARYSTAGIVARFVSRRLLSFVGLYVVLRIFGIDLFEKGWLFLMAALAVYSLIGLDELIADLKRNREVQKAIADGQDPETLAENWNFRELRTIKIYSLLGLAVGIWVLTGSVDFFGYLVPSWVGIPMAALALALLLFPKRFANEPSPKAYITHSLPPDFAGRD